MTATAHIYVATKAASEVKLYTLIVEKYGKRCLPAASALAAFIFRRFLKTKNENVV